MTGDIGTRLRAARMAQGMSLRSVASALGVSPSLVSQVETGKTQPSVSTLYALVNHLGISFDDLLAGSDDGKAHRPTGHGQEAPPAKPLFPRVESGDPAAPPVQRAEDNPVLEMENGVRWERLSVLGNGSVDPLLVTYEPGASSSVEGKMMRHSGVEYAYLLSGELTLRLDFETHVFRTGDSLSFDSVRPHMYINEGDKPATGLWFVLGRREFSSEMPEARSADQRERTSLNSAVDVLQAIDRLA